MPEMEEIGPTRVPERVSGADLTKVKLLPQEGFLYSLIDGKLTIDDMKLVTGLRDEEIRGIIQKFLDLGIVRLRVPHLDPRDKVGYPGEKTVSAPRKTEAKLDSPKDDSRSFEDRVSELYINIDSQDYYLVLGVDRNAEEKEIKAAFYKLTKEYHPDRFHNLMQHPYTTIQVGPTTLQVEAHQAQGEEYTRLWELVTHQNEQYIQYQKGLKRRIPIVILTPTTLL